MLPQSLAQTPMLPHTLKLYDEPEYDHKPDAKHQ
jgi:hypothetical protein